MLKNDEVLKNLKKMIEFLNSKFESHEKRYSSMYFSSKNGTSTNIWVQRIKSKNKVLRFVEIYGLEKEIEQGKKITYKITYYEKWFISKKATIKDVKSIVRKILEANPCVYVDIR